MPATKHSRIIDLLRKAIALLIGCAIVLATLEKMGGVPAHGEESAVEDADSAIAFRRIFAPADRIDTWPRDSVRYLPIESDEFEKLVKDAQARSGSAAKLEPARITTAEYRATLEGDEFNGELTWTIANAGQSATFMELPTLGIAIESAQWAADSRPALLGADPRGKCGLWVDTTGSLRAKWSFKGETASGQESLAFRMSLPSAVQNRLILDIPSTSVLTVDRGWARSIPGAAPGWNRLQIDLGAEHQVVIHLAAESVIPEFAIPARYRQTESYEIAPHGMTLETRLRVASRRRPLERLTLKVDRGLSPVAVSANGQIISWSMRATASEGVSEMELQFAEPRLHDDLVIDILSLGVKPEVVPLILKENALRVLGVSDR